MEPLGTLQPLRALEHGALLAPAAFAGLQRLAPGDDVGVAEIDPALADTQAFCERYGVALAASANCVILTARRDGRRWLAACVALATTRVDVNAIAKRELGASKISFAPMDDAVAASQMEYGGITPLGLPPDWPILVDAAVVAAPRVVIGSGVRLSKLILAGAVLGALPNARVIDGLARAV